MAESFTIHIDQRSVSGVLLSSNAKKAPVVKNYAFEPLVDANDNFEAAVTRVKEQIGFDGRDCVVSLSPQYFSFRKVWLPFADRKKIARILPFEIEEQFSLDSSTMQVDFVLSEKEGGSAQILAGLLPTDYLADVLKVLNSCDLEPEVVTLGLLADFYYLGEEYDDLSSFFVLEIGNNYASVSVVQDGEPLLIRSLPVAELSAPGQWERTLKNNLQQALQAVWMQVERTLLAEGWGEELGGKLPGFLSGSVGMNYQVLGYMKKYCYPDLRIFDLSAKPFLKIHSGSESKLWKAELMNRPLALALYQTEQNKAYIFNFRKGQFRKKISPILLNRYMSVGLIAFGVVVAVCLGFGGWEYRQLMSTKAGLKKEIEQTFRSALPQVSKIVNPVQQLRSAIDEATENFETGAQEGAGFSKLEILAEISGRVPADLPVTVVQLVADFETVRIKAQTNDFNNVDRIKKELTKSVMFKTVTISSANVASDDGSVRFDLKLELN